MIDFKPLTTEHVPFLVRWFNNPNANEFLGGHGKLTIKKQVEKIERQDKNFKSFVICQDKKPIGMISLNKIDRQNHNADLFIVIGEDECRGKGIGKQALKFITDFGFTQLGLHKIYLRVHVENTTAIKCYESFGFTREGILKDQYFKSGKYYDELAMAVIGK